jgi:hypothetical protein
MNNITLQMVNTQNNRHNLGHNFKIDIPMGTYQAKEVAKQLVLL